MTIVSELPLPVNAPVQEPVDTRSTAETAECTCPEFCERDHDVD